jgi:Flp pilus assembly protein TadD
MTPREDQAVPEIKFGKAPRVVRSVDIRSLPIGPEEAFVLSCIDGMTTQDDIASATGFDSDAVARIMNRLTELGAIEFESVSTERTMPPASRVSVNSSGAYRIGPILEIRESGPSQHPGAIAREESDVAMAMSNRVASAAQEDSDLPAPSRMSGEFEVSCSVAPSVHPSSVAPDSAEARRRALARKLGHSSAPPSRSTTMRAPPESAVNFRAEEAQRQEQLAAQARQQQVDRYVALAKEAAEQHDLVSATNSLKIACSLAPEDAGLAQKLASMQQRAAEENWEEYAERANYEVFEGRLAEAARSYEFAALGHPTWRFFERAAFCYLNSGGDLKRACELAKRAVALAPDNSRCHLTLAQIYIAAKLKQSALAELERALALDPKQDSIRETIRSVKRGAL